MVIDRVYIETNATEDDVRTVLDKAGISVSNAPTDGQGYPVRLSADVPNDQTAIQIEGKWHRTNHRATTAKQEVTAKLTEAGIEAHVYE